MRRMTDHFHIPGRATRREYSVYVMLARHRQSGKVNLYVGKTGDNKDGCNPVISRAGNHFSFNKIHSQMRNKLPFPTEDCDFEFFYATFGPYVDPKVCRDGIDLINEMERQLSRLAHEAFGPVVIDPYEGKTKLRRWQRDKRDALATQERLSKLRELIEAVRAHIGSQST